MTHDYIEHQFCDYMFVQKLCTHRDIETETLCHKMEMTSEAFTEYLHKEHRASFKKVVHECRIEKAKYLWEKSGTIPIRRVARAVGDGNSLVLLLHFIRFEHCLLHVWKRKNLILI